MATVAPLTPGDSSMHAAPPTYLPNAYTWARPRPLPLPTSFVVRKGSNARAFTASGNPLSVSATDSRTQSVSRCSAKEMARACRGTFDPEMVIVPPSGMASRAFVTTSSNAGEANTDPDAFFQPQPMRAARNAPNFLVAHRDLRHGSKLVGQESS